jgi:hypothetical protein
MAACVLHNFIRKKFPKMTNNLLDHEDPNSHDIIPGAWRQDVSLCSLTPMRGNNMTQMAKAQRDYLAQYFTSEAGRVSWQDTKI